MVNNKNHYFIGYMIRFDKNLKHSLHKSQKYIQSFLYLVYLDDETAYNLIHTKLDSILQILVDKLSKQSNNLTCNIEQEIKIFGHKQTYKKIGIFYKNDVIEKKIVPVLRNITQDIYGEYKYDFNPHINIMSIYPMSKSKLELLKSKLLYSNISLPISFTFDSIDILKSSTLETRTGKSSKNDESKVETLFTYKINKPSITVQQKVKKKTLINTITKLFSI